MEPVAETHPPRVTEPEKWFAIGMLEIAMVGRHANGTMPVEWVCARVWHNPNVAGDAIQPFVLRIGTFTTKMMDADGRRSVASLPSRAAGPKRGHTERFSIRIGEYDI